jgi:hypothetical protein
MFFGFLNKFLCKRGFQRFKGKVKEEKRGNSLNAVYLITKRSENADSAEFLAFLMLLIVFTADCRYNSQGEWACGKLAG